jgi:hypothetical protein
MAVRRARRWSSAPLVAALIQLALTTQPASGAIRLVQASPEASAPGATITATLPAGSTAGNLLVAAVEDVNNNCSTDSFTAPSGWVKAAHVCRGGTGPLELWYRPNTAAGVTSVAFDSGSNGSSSILEVSEWSGVATSAALDQTGTRNNPASSTTLGVSTTGNVAASGELAITAFDTSAGLSTFTPGASWTSLRSDPSGGFDSDYRVGPPAGSVLSESPTSSPQTDWAAAIATFKPTCTGGSLTIKTASTLSFPGVTLSGYNQSTTAAMSLTADDESGSGSGWNLNATSTTFDAGSGRLLPTTATTFTSGSASAAAGNCSLPTNTVAYPLTLPAGATPPTAIRLFDAGAATGAGPSSVSLGAKIALPANTRAGTYSSTWTLTLSSGP